MKLKKIANNNSKIVSYLKKHRIVPFVVIFGCIGVATLLLTAASSGSSFEAESATKSNSCVSDISDTAASGSKAIQFGCTQTTGFIHPGVVYTQADIDNWSTSSDEYKNLAASGAGSLTSTSTRYVPVVFGTRIDSNGESGGDYKDPNNELNFGFKDQSSFAKVQAVLFAADNNNSRRNKVISYLSQLRTVTSIEWDSGEQWRLTAGWACTNYAQAAELVNYQDEQFKRFLKDVCYPIMDWPVNPNWHASFADSKLAIAAYLSDTELWTDAKAYFYERIKQSIYHSKYDGNKVNPLHTEDRFWKNADGTTTVETRIHTSAGTPNANQTLLHWGGYLGVSQIKSDYTFGTDYGPPVDGINAERMRDLGHVNMSYASWMHGARTILAQGEQLQAHAWDRIREGYGYHADRVLYYIQTGTFKAPAPLRGDGGVTRFWGFEGAVALFGDQTPATVLGILQEPDVINRAPAGFNQLVAEQFADGLSVPR